MTCHWLILFSPVNLASLPDEIRIGANFFADEFQRLVDSYFNNAKLNHSFLINNRLKTLLDHGRL